MKRFALLVIGLLALAAPAFAINGVGDISAYADDQGNSCNITSPGGGAIVNVYIVHKFLLGEQATGSRFKVVFPTGLSFLAFSTPFTPVGNLTTDLSLGYGLCLTDKTMLGSALCSSSSVSPTCSYVTVANSDIMPEVIATNCLFAEITCGKGQAIANPDGTCQCNIATEPSSWGKVKALYR